jgi:subtilisin family serine protease
MSPRLARLVPIAFAVLGACVPAMQAQTQPAPRTGTLPIVESRTASWALDRLDAREFELDSIYRRQGTGAGVTVYVFDSGIAADHPELLGRVRTGFNGYPKEKASCTAHGTSVAGAIGGKTLGVASEVELVDVKVLRCGTGVGNVDMILRATQWVVRDHKARGGAAVANWSLSAGEMTGNAVLEKAVASLREAGITVIASAGNVAIDACRTAPANTPGVVVVGSVGPKAGAAVGAAPHDWRVAGTAYGACVDVYAPGVDVDLPGFDRAGQPVVQKWSGTSMAAGYVSGTAALFLEATPRAQPSEVAAWLARSATPDRVYDARAAGARVLFAGVQLAEITVAIR